LDGRAVREKRHGDDPRLVGSLENKNDTHTRYGDSMNMT
jgi:hypothetical protein